MRSVTSYFAPVLAVAGVGAYLALAPLAAAAPECTNITSATTICQTNGSTQIVTSPPPINNYGMWPYWADGFAFGPWGW